MRKVCAMAGCKAITTTRYCPKCQAIMANKAKQHAKTRARKSQVNMQDSHKAFYGSAAWKKLRDKKLRQDPLCESCLDKGFIKEGRDIDHIVEIKDDWDRRLDITNLKTLCRSCHMAKTAEEKRQRKSMSRMESPRENRAGKYSFY